METLVAAAASDEAIIVEAIEENIILSADQIAASASPELPSWGTAENIEKLSPMLTDAITNQDCFKSQQDRRGRISRENQLVRLVIKHRRNYARTLTDLHIRHMFTQYNNDLEGQKKVGVKFNDMNNKRSPYRREYEQANFALKKSRSYNDAEKKLLTDMFVEEEREIALLFNDTKAKLDVFRENEKVGDTLEPREAVANKLKEIGKSRKEDKLEADREKLAKVQSNHEELNGTLSKIVSLFEQSVASANAISSSLAAFLTAKAEAIKKTGKEEEK
jgi:hypothetical protein